MALAIEDQALGTTGRAGSTVTATLAGTPSDGELIVAVLELTDAGLGTDSTGNRGTAPSGFTLAKRELIVGSSGIVREVAIWYKVASSESGTSYSWTGFSTSSSDYCKKGLTLIVISGFTSPVVDETNGTQSTSSGTTIGSGSITPTAATAAMVFGAVGATGGGSATLTWSDSFVEQSDGVIGGSGSNPTVGASTRLVTSSSTYSSTATFSETLDARIGAIVAFVEDGGSDDRAAQLSFSEFEVPNAPRAAQLSFAEFEVPFAPRAAQLSWAEFEVPLAPRAAQVSWAEFETPDIPARAAQVSFCEFQVPGIDAAAQVSWFELQVPDIGEFITGYSMRNQKLIRLQ